jgi:hypothetical protein
LASKYGDFYFMPFFFHKTIFLVGVATLVFGHHQVGKFRPQKNMLLIIRGSLQTSLPNALGEPPTPKYITKG